MPPPTLKDIKAKLGRTYRHPDALARDVHALITNFSALKIQNLSDYVHSNGSREKLLSITGTIPVKIRGTTYNIPIAIWLKNTHPYHPPFVYVTPTTGMGIQQSQFVDSNGMVYLPYLTEWKQQTSDLTALSQILCATFADHCPVYSKPTQPQWQPPRPVQPPTSYRSPGGGGGGGYGNYPLHQPPRPQQPTPQPYPAYSTPYPNQPPSHMPVPNVPVSYGGYPPQPQTSSAGPPPYPMGGPGQYPPPQSTSSSLPPARPPPPSVTSSVALGAAAAASMSAAEERRQIEESEKIKRQSMETAVEDKIRRHVTAALNEAEKEMQVLQTTQQELQDGSRKINEMMEEMENKQKDVERSIDMLKEKNTELESVLDYLKSQPDKIDVDEAVTATTPLHNQILQLYAEENAVEDTIYYLGEALRKGVIELEAFLKHVRELSRKQFMARATIMKARSTAGLPPHGHPS